MILYFSATGNTAYVAQALADLLQEPETVCLNSLIHTREPQEFYSEKPFVILSPVYLSSIPDEVQHLLHRCHFSGTENVWFIMTCAGSTSASGYFAEKFCKEKGLHYMGTVHLSMPQDYLIYFQTKSPKENQEKLEKAVQTLPSLAACIRTGKSFAEKKPGRLHVGVIRPVDILFRKYFIRPEKFYAAEGCVSCGKCAKVCPLGNIHMKDGKPTWGADCIHCTACINRCPKNAIEYGRRTQGKLRYTAPVYRKRR